MLSMWGRELASTGFGRRPLTGYFKHDNEISDYIQGFKISWSAKWL
jgi:hypothetical protein